MRGNKAMHFKVERDRGGCNVKCFREVSLSYIPPENRRFLCFPTLVVYGNRKVKKIYGGRIKLNIDSIVYIGKGPRSLSELSILEISIF